MASDRDLNLLADFRRLSANLSDALRSDTGVTASGEIALDAFLYAAGLQQIVEDFLHREAFVLKRASRLTAFDSRLLRIAGRTTVAAVAAVSAVRRLRPSERYLARWAEQLAVILEQLATAAMVEQRTEAVAETRQAWERLCQPHVRFPKGLMSSQVRLPNPLCNFDQSPEDFRELVRRFTERFPDRERAILVVGVRASGAYLAPLHAALLRDAGYSDVLALTVRPRQKWRAGEKAHLDAVTRAAGLILVLDDPPLRGAAVAQVAQELEQLGAPSRSILLGLPLFGPESSLPEALRGYRSLLLPWRDWAIQRLLGPAEVRSVLIDLLVGRDVDLGQRTIRVVAVADVERLDAPGPEEYARDRAHVSAVFRAHLVGGDSERVERDIEVEGVGVGYFAAQKRRVAEALTGYVPQVFGVENGLLYQQRLPEEWRLDPLQTAGLESRLLAYVRTRRDRLAVGVDPTPGVEGYAVWRIVADILGTALLERLRSFAYPLTHAASQRLLSVSKPCLVDGYMAPEAWSARPSTGPGGALKSGWTGGAVCYDPQFDLATAAASFEVEERLRAGSDEVGRLRDRLLEEYRETENAEIDQARWLLYELMYNHDLLVRLSHRLAAADGRSEAERTADRWLATERALAAANQRFFAGTYFADLEPSSIGPLCGIDIDGTLETRWLDFPAITPAGALALRALTRHGYRPVLATGRSLDELRERCHAYRLAGGVAEYGAVAYHDVSGEVRTPPEEAEDQMARVRDILREFPEAYLDPSYRYVVRAFRFDAAGRRRGLHAETIAAALGAVTSGEPPQVSKGGYQTDFIPAFVTKESGLRALAEMMGVRSDAPEPLAFAVGDDWTDVSMLRLARAPFVPANMGRPLRDELCASLRVRVTRDPGAAGLLQAVSSFLDHRPRRCRTCAPPAPSESQQLVLTALAGSDGPRRARLTQAVRLALLLLRTRPPSY